MQGTNQLVRVLVYLLLGLEVPELAQELCLGGELGRLQEVQKAKELLHRVLQRSARQQHLVLLGEGEEGRGGGGGSLSLPNR